MAVYSRLVMLRKACTVIQQFFHTVESNKIDRLKLPIISFFEESLYRQRNNNIHTAVTYGRVDESDRLEALPVSFNEAVNYRSM